MKNLVFHGCNKHIDTCFHFICECVEKPQNVVKFACTTKHVLTFTKALARVESMEMLELLRISNKVKLIGEKEKLLTVEKLGMLEHFNKKLLMVEHFYLF